MINKSIEGLRSLKIEIQNFKNITSTVIDIGGRSMLFMGKNNTGKSTLIQAMMSPTDSKIVPTEPITEGEERAKISHKIGGVINGVHTEYTMDIHFSQKNKKGTVKLYNAKGEEIKSPSTMIKSIIGNVSFDVTRWLNDDKAKKLKTLKALTGCGIQIDTITAEIKNIESDMKYKSSRADELEASVKNNEFTTEEVEKYSVPIPMEPLHAELSNISSEQATWDDVKNKTNGFATAIINDNAVIERSNAELKRLMELINVENDKISKSKSNILVNEGNIKIANEWFSANQRPSVEVVSKKITEATAHNEKHSRILMLGAQQKEMITLKQDVQALKSSIKKKVDERNQVISNSQLPVAGLSFSDDDIFINGLPLEEGQINTATLFDVGVEVAMALNPNLKIIFLHDGSLFDKEHLKSIVNKIESKGYQAIIELVNESAEVEVVFTEEVL